jgi:hypothetical protein
MKGNGRGLSVQTRHFLGKSEKNHEESVILFGIPAEIQTERFLSTSQKE